MGSDRSGLNPPRIEIMLEEESAQIVLKRLFARILAGQEIGIQFHQFDIKPINLQNRKRELENRLRIYQDMIQNGLRVAVLVLIDADRDDCKQLKQELETVAQRAGLHTKTNPRGNRFHVVNRIVIEELEAWYFGDPVALKTAYPRLSETILQRHARNPDAIKGGTKERLYELLNKAGYYLGRPAQILIANRVSPHMQPDRNTSPSFQTFANGMKALSGQLLSP